MSRIHRITLLVPAVVVILNALALVVVGSPCLPGDLGCVNP
jgi:hypothetical protein